MIYTRFNHLASVARLAILEKRNPIVAMRIVMIPRDWTASDNDLGDVMASAMAQLRKDWR